MMNFTKENAGNPQSLLITMNDEFYKRKCWKSAKYTEDVPYDEFDTMKAIQENVVEGYRLQIPEETPKIWKKTMTQCWHEKPDKRPQFSEIVKKWEKHLKKQKPKKKTKRFIHQTTDASGLIICRHYDSDETNSNNSSPKQRQSPQQRESRLRSSVKSNHSKSDEEEYVPIQRYSDDAAFYSDDSSRFSPSNDSIPNSRGNLQPLRQSPPIHSKSLSKISEMSEEVSELETPKRRVNQKRMSEPQLKKSRFFKKQEPPKRIPTPKEDRRKSHPIPRKFQTVSDPYKVVE